MKTVLITGGAGFIGSNYVRYALQRHTDWRVVVYDKLTYAGNLDNLKDVAEQYGDRYAFVRGDIADRQAVGAAMREHGVNTIINFAADTHVDRSLMEPGSFITTDVYGTFVLLEAAGEFKVERYHQISSVTGDTPLLVRRRSDGYIALRPIEQLDQEDLACWDVLTMTTDHRVDFAPMRHFVKHPVDELYEVVYNGGGKIRATGSHSVFVFTERGIETKPTSELQQGDLLVTFTGVTLSERLPHVFDLRTLMQDYSYEGMDAALAKRQKLVQAIATNPEATASQLGTTLRGELYPSTTFRLVGALAAEGLLQRSEEGLITVTDQNIREGCEGAVAQWWQLAKNKLHIPMDSLCVTETLMEVFGLYLAEGHAAHTDTEMTGAVRSVTFTIGKKEMQQLDLLKHCASDILGIHASVKQRQSTWQIAYNSRWVHALFSQFGVTAETKRLPAWIWTQPVSLIRAFFKGYEGDAAIKPDARRIYTTVNKSLAVNLMWLARMNNINCLMSERTVQQIAGEVPPGSTVTRRRTFYDLQVTAENARPGESGQWRTPMSRCVPSSWAIHMLGSRHAKGLYVCYKQLTSKRRLAYLAQKREANNEQLASVLGSPIGVAKVKSIRRLSGPFMVYDVSVPGSERFFGGNVPCLLHNTDEVYGQVLTGRSTEEDKLHTRSPYSASKAGGDLMCLAYHTSFGVPVTITRGSNNIGPYQYPEKAVPLFITNAIDNLPLPLYGDGKQQRDYQFVLDHCEGIDVVIEKGQPGEVYNIGSGAETANIDMAHAVLDLLGKPYSLIQPITDRPGHDRRYALDTSKARALGWTNRYDFRQAIEETVRWYADNEWWWRKLKTGEYLEYYRRQYAGRGGSAGQVSV